MKIVAPFGYEVTLRDPRSGANVTEIEWSELTFENLYTGDPAATFPSIVIRSKWYPGSGVIKKRISPPGSTGTGPDGEIFPLLPDVAVIV